MNSRLIGLFFCGGLGMACATTATAPSAAQEPVTALDLVGGDAAFVVQLRPDRYGRAVDRLQQLMTKLPKQAIPRPVRRLSRLGDLSKGKRAETLAGLIYVHTGHFLSWWDPSHPAAFAFFKSRPQDMEALAALSSGGDLSGEAIGHRIALPSGNPEALIGEVRALLKPFLEQRQGGEVFRHRQLGTWWFSAVPMEGHALFSYYQDLGAGPAAQQAPAGASAWLAGPSQLNRQAYRALRNPQVGLGAWLHVPSLNRTGELMGIKNALDSMARVPAGSRGEFIGNALDIFLMLRRFGDGPAELEALALAAMGPDLEVARMGVMLRPYAQGLWSQAQNASQGALSESADREVYSLEFALKDLVGPAEPAPWLGSVTRPRQVRRTFRMGGPWLMPLVLRAPVSLLSGAVKHPAMMAVAGPMGLQPMEMLPGRVAVQVGPGEDNVVIAVEMHDAAAQVAEQQLSGLLARAGKAKAMRRAHEGPLDLVLLGPVKVDFEGLKRRPDGNQNRLGHAAKAGKKPHCAWRYVAESGAIQGGCALDDEPLGDRYRFSMGPALTEDDRPADSRCRQRMAPLLSELMKAAPDQLAQQVAATTAGLDVCLAQSTKLSEAGKVRWRTVVDAFVKEAKATEARALEQPEAMGP